MRRFVTLVILLLFSIPFGVSISGCSKTAPPVFCNGGDSGLTTGQATTISLTPIVYGISLNFAEIGQVNMPSATDCKGTSVSTPALTYGTTDMTIADVQPGTGKLCGGTWNRNTGGGIADFTSCLPTGKSGTAYISASSQGVTSNPIPVFVHPKVTSIVLGGTSACAKDPSGNFIDPTTACCPLTTIGSPTAEAPYTTTGCVSQGHTAQLIARIYAGTGANQTNISCQAGNPQFSAQGTSSQGSAAQVVTIDSNGVATANQPGSVLLSATIANASSSAGFFSTCPPVSITLAAPGASSNPVVVNQNNTQPLLATAVDQNGVSLTGLSLEYVSTSPTTIPAGSGSVVPPLAGAASISAICQPPGCNSAPSGQIGLFGNGKPVTSDSVNIVAPGTNSTVLYMASTQSQYIVSRDFTQTSAAAPVLLPYLPNSMVITNDGSTIYMGSSNGLMVLSASSTLSILRTDITQPGTVLAVSPNGNQIVISDPVKNLITLDGSSGGVISTYGATCPASLCRAEFAPDSQTVYIAAGNQVLVYSAYTGWTNITATTFGNPLVTPAIDVAITVPSVGAYFAGTTTTAHSYCAVTTIPPATPTIEDNIFYPQADNAPVTTDRIAATNDGLHIVGATATTFPPTLSDLLVQVPTSTQRVPVSAGSGFSIPCPPDGTALTFSNTVASTPLSQITASVINGVFPTSDSKVAFITYTGSGGVLPAYAPAASGAGQVTPVKLSGTAATAPIAGVLSADNTTFFAGTSGDNLVHLITITPGTPDTESDTSTLAPNLTSPLQIPITGVVPGSVVPVNLLVQKPRKTT